MNAEKKLTVCRAVVVVMLLLCLGLFASYSYLSQEPSTWHEVCLFALMVCFSIALVSWYIFYFVLWNHHSLVHNLKWACGYVSVFCGVFVLFEPFHYMLSKFSFILSAFYLSVFILLSIISLFVGRIKKAGKAAGS